MRKKIWRMSEGQFEEAAPILAFEPYQLNYTFTEHTSFSGSFLLTSTNGIPAKGLVYSTHPYVYTLTPAFNDVQTTISFEVISDQFKRGDVLEGEFIVICNGLKTSLPFRMEVVGHTLSTSIGEITSLEDFSDLARRQWKEASSLFYTDDFLTFIQSQSVSEQLLYKGYRHALHSSANLEAFLSGAGLKPPMNFNIDTTEKMYSFVSENIKESVEITRSTWGHIEIAVSCDADFVSVEKEVLTSDFFLGTKLSMNYYVHKERLHAGLNVATISFDGVGVHRQLTIKASTMDLNEIYHNEALAQKKLILKLWRTYEAYRLKELNRDQWSMQTIDLIYRIQSFDRNVNGLYLDLLKTHAMIVGDKKEEALGQMKILRTNIKDKRSVEWAYLLYLGALMDPEESYVKQLTSEIESIFVDHPEDVRVFWYLLFLREDFRKDAAVKVKAIRQWINAGYHSPALYVEIYDLYLQDPYLLNRLDDTTLNILGWAKKHRAITSAIADRLFDLIGREDAYNPKVFALLEESFTVALRKEYLSDILAYLLRFQVFNPDVREWFERGVEEQLKITGLYEGYVSCLPLKSLEPLPPSVVRYFAYTSSITYERKALIYANIVSNKKNESFTYEQYLPMIHAFCLEQMKLGHIDDNLAILYQDMLDHGYIDAQLADHIAGLLNMQKVICLSDQTRRVFVYEDLFEEPFVSVVNDHAAYVPIFTDRYQVFLEMQDGRFLTQERLYYLEPMLSARDIRDNLKRLSAQRLLYFYSDFAQMESATELAAEDLPVAEELLFSPVVSADYLKKKFYILLAFFKDYEKEDVILKALMHNDRYKDLDTTTINYLLELLIIDENYEAAEKLLRTYLCMDADPMLMLRLMDFMVTRPREENGELVLEICIYLLRNMFYTQKTLAYLNAHYIGSTDDMLLIFKYIDRHLTDISKLSERILVQMLYTERMDEDCDQVFMAYCEHKNNITIIEAYLTYFAHHYLIEGTQAPPSVFAILFQQERVGYEMNDVCRMALLKYLSFLPEPEGKEVEVLDRLVRLHMQKNIYFSFYRHMHRELVVKYHLYDKMFAEYIGEPQKRLRIRYKKDDGPFTESDLFESYYGIYVRRFIIFFGETIYYEIFDEDDCDVILQSGELVHQDIIEEGKTSRYGLLNHMESAYLYRNDEEMIGYLHQYQKMNAATEALLFLL